MAMLYAREGGEFLVNTNTANQQVRPKTAALSGGGYVIVWQDSSGLGGDASNSAIKGQRYDSNGEPVGAEFLINTSTNNGQLDPSVTATASGGFFVAWTDFSGSLGDFDGSVKGQFFSSAGAKVGGEILLNTTTAGDQTEPTVATLADGAIAVTWQMPSGDSSAPRSYRTQVFEANGARRGGETVVANAGGFEGAPPAVTGLAGGGYVVSWESNQYVYARMFSASGAPVGNAFKLSESVFGGEQYQTLQATPDGGFIAAWAHWGGESRNDIVARKFTSTGAPAGAQFIVTEGVQGQQFAPDIAAIPGGYIITWQAQLGPFPQTWEIKAQIYDSNFNRSGGEFFVNTDQRDNQTGAQLAVLANGRVLVTWQGFDGKENSGIKAQLLTPSPGPTDIALSTGSIVETAVENMPFATVSSNGAVNSNLTYTYLGDSLGGAFRLEGTQLIVNDSGRLDAEVHNTVGVWIQVTDGDGHSYDEVIVLNVTDSIREARYTPGPIQTATDATEETAHLSNGGFIHLRGKDNDAWFADVYDPSGNLLRTAAAATPTDAFGVKAAGLAGGNFVVIWNSMGNVYGQLHDNMGNPISAVFPVNTTSESNQIDPGVTALSGGGFVAAWYTSFLGETGLFAQIFDAAGNKVGEELVIVPEDFGSHHDPEPAGLSNGGFVLTWTDDLDIMAQIFDAAGTAVGGAFTVNTTTTGSQSNQKVVALAGGGFVVAWMDDSVTDGTGGGGTRAQVFDNLGNKVGGEILIDTTLGHQIWPDIDATPDGGFVLVWGYYVSTDEALAMTSAMKGQFFDAGGNPSGPIFEISGDIPLIRWPGVVALGNGDLFATWSQGTKRLLRLEHPVVAANDSNTTPENAFVHGNLLANDFAQPGAALRIGAVQGQAANIGETITLPSGATVQVNANGNYTYNPNGAFPHLVGASGAANHSATDSFAYTLTNGTTATATITVTGVGSNGDRPQGTAGSDIIAGTDFAEQFDLDQGGNDNVQGNGGTDAFYFGATLTSADIVNGGAGLDTLILQGNYAGGVTIGTGVTGIEALSFFAGTNTGFGDPGTNRYDYVITTSDSNFAAGLQVKVNAAPLLVGEDFTFNGSAETNATFLIYGGQGVDTLTGGLGSDIFFFADGDRLAPGDTINGGAGHDGLFLRGNYVIDFSTPGYSNLLTSIENITVTSIADERYARGGGTEFDYNIKFGDAQVGAGGILTVSGALLQANETLVVDGSLETNGAFRIFGGASNDTLRGGTGADFIEGGLGVDTLTGGGGNDLFNYKARAESIVGASDQILDFATGDKIDLGAIDANSTTAANDAFAWIGTAAFSGQAGQLRGSAVGNVWTVQGDVDGNGVADFQIVVTVADNHPIAAGDFFL